MQKENKQLLVVTHLSQLLDFVTGFGGFIVPLVIWLTQRNTILNMDETGKAILNFRISTFIYFILCIPLILLFGLGILGFIFLIFLSFIFPILNAVRVSNGQEPSYPLSIKIL